MNPSELLQRFEDLPFTVELELGELVMSIGDIFALQEGTVLRTDHVAGVPLTLLVGGVDLATAEVVVIDDCVSARINKISEKKQASTEGHGSN